jgi:hypothetical protein
MAEGCIKGWTLVEGGEWTMHPRGLGAKPLFAPLSHEYIAGLKRVSHALQIVDSLESF